jgi:probable HAF family extracellular repeat protein
MQMQGYRRTTGVRQTTRSSRARRLWTLIAASAAVGVTATTAVPALATTYSITDLGNLGYQYTVANGINNNGQVTGHSSTKQTIEGGCSLRFRPCPTHLYDAFRWEAGTMTDLGTLGGHYSEGTAINNLGEVAGNSQLKNGERHAFVFRNGKMTDLNPGVTGREIHAAAINEAGVVAGSWSIPGEGHTDAVIWINGKITDLGLLPGEGGIFTGASGINKTNEVVGSGDNKESMERAWVWRNGTMTDIGTLGGPQAAADAINNSGQIVGFAQTSTDADHGFIYSNGKMTELGLNIFPYAINNNGVIVGSGGCGGAIIVSGGICQNLQNLIPAGSGYTLQEARGINDKGQIIAYAQPEPYASNPIHAVLLTPNS